MSEKLIVKTSNAASYLIDLVSPMAIGKGLDNDIVINDREVSRYHAILEKRHDNYFIRDLGANAGTLVNGERVKAEQLLKDHDTISIGYHTTLQLSLSYIAETNYQQPASEEIIASANTQQPRLQLSWLQIGIAVGIGLFIATSISIIAYFITRPVTIDANGLKFTTPHDTALIEDKLNIAVDIDSQLTKAIDQVIYEIDFQEITRSRIYPYTASINLKELTDQYPNFTQGNHILTATIQDINDHKERQSSRVLLSFEQKSNLTNPQSNNSANTNIDNLVDGFARQISQKSGYRFDNQLLQDVALKANQYAAMSPAFDNICRYSPTIAKVARDKGLPPLLLITVLVNQQLLNNSTEANAAIWQIPAQFLNGNQDSSTMSFEQSLNMLATYMRELINIFGVDDFPFAIACFGLSIERAGQIQIAIQKQGATQAVTRVQYIAQLSDLGLLPPNTNNNLVRFLSTGIIIENPQRFGLQNNPLSNCFN